MSSVNQDDKTKRIFLSYSRSDDEPFVKRLHGDLVAAGLTVWFDRESLMSRGLTFHQEIKDTIRTEIDRVVYVGGPKAAQSLFVREEWLSALEYDHVVVVPILRLGDYDNSVPGELKLLHCEDFRDDGNYASALRKLVADLQQSNPKLGALFAVPSLPPHFLGRSDLMLRVRDALRVDLQTPKVITSADAKVGMQGMGGIGKSVLAAALARNREIRQSYPDGVVWISFGQGLTDDDLVARLRDLARHLGADTSFTSLPQGQSVLRECLQPLAVLLVLDDVWRAKDEQVFDVLGPRCRMLVTTRDAGILHALQGDIVPVSLFSQSESLQLLADAVSTKDNPVTPGTLPPEAREVASECGSLPLALALSGGMARKHGGNFKSVLERLRRADLDKIADRASINEQHQSIWRAMQASVDVLDEDEQRRFTELGVFDTDGTVPQAAAAVLWSHTGRLDDLDSEDLLVNLSERSLVQLDQKTDPDGTVRRRFRLHDLLHDYAVRIAGDPHTLHRTLLDAYRAKSPDGWHSGPNDGYFFERLVNHFAAAEEWVEAECLMTDFAWLMRKCEIGYLESIATDFSGLNEAAPSDTRERLAVWRTFFRERAHILRRGNDQWPAHRILLQLAVEHADDSPLTTAAEEWLTRGHCDWLWLRAKARPCHIRRGSELVVIECPTHDVNGVLVLPNGNILSWSNEPVLRMWNSVDGSSVAVLTGHRGIVKGAYSLPNGNIISWASRDLRLRVWDRNTGSCLAVLEEHDCLIKGVLVLPNGNVVSWANEDGLTSEQKRSGNLPSLESVINFKPENSTLRIWSTNDEYGLVGQTKVHGGEIKEMRVLPNGSILSWTGGLYPKDFALRIWDAQNGSCQAILNGHCSEVKGASILANGCIVSWDDGPDLRVWTAQNGICQAVLKGHDGIVRGALAMPNGNILSWARDDSLRMWSPESGTCLSVNECNGDTVSDALVLPDGNIMFWTGGNHSKDNVIRILDVQNGSCRAVFQRHAQEVNGVQALSDGRFVSWSRDGVLQIWRADSACAQDADLSSAGRTLGVLSLPGKRFCSWDDASVRVWSAVTGDAMSILRTNPRQSRIKVEGVLALPDGCLFTWPSRMLWDGTDKIAIEVPKSPSALLETTGALLLPNSRILLWESLGTFGVWNCGTKTYEAVLNVIPNFERNEVCVLSDGRVLIVDDSILHIWDAQRSLDLVDVGSRMRGLRSAFLRVLAFFRGRHIRIFDGPSDKRLAVLKGHEDSVIGMRELSNGNILSWSADFTLRIWSAQDGTCLGVLKGHENRVNGASVLPNGNILSWSWDRTLRVWDIHKSLCVTTIELPESVDRCLTMPDGSILLCNSDDGRTRRLELWNGTYTAVTNERELDSQHPAWRYAMVQDVNKAQVAGDYCCYTRDGRSAHILQRDLCGALAVWHGVSGDAGVCQFLEDPPCVVVGHASGGVQRLGLYRGANRIDFSGEQKPIEPSHV